MLLFYAFRLTDEINEGKHGITAPPAGLSKKQENLLNTVPAYDECVQRLQLSDLSIFSTLLPSIEFLAMAKHAPSALSDQSLQAEVR